MKVRPELPAVTMRQWLLLQIVYALFVYYFRSSNLRKKQVRGELPALETILSIMLGADVTVVLSASADTCGCLRNACTAARMLFWRFGNLP